MLMSCANAPAHADDLQDPQASLNHMTVGSIIAEPLDEHRALTRAERRGQVESLLDDVGLDPVLPIVIHSSRAANANALVFACALRRTKFIVCDEPIAALDVSIQAQVVNLLEDLQQRLGLTYLFISHDLSMVRHIADRVAVMYLGKIVEMADRKSLYREQVTSVHTTVVCGACC